MKIRCVIVEDEPKALQLIEEYVAQINFLELVGKAHTPLLILDFLRTNKIDLLFLDINLPGISGMELTDMLEKDIKIIFTTAYSQYALKSYEKNAVDYLLKPITFHRFLQAALKARNIIETSRKAKEGANSPDSFFVKSGKKIIHLQWSEIYYIEGYKEYITIVTDTARILVYKRMKDIEEYNVGNLIRVHNSYIINLEKIQKLEDNHIYIKDKVIPIGRTYKEEFTKKLQRRII